MLVVFFGVVVWRVFLVFCGGFVENKGLGLQFLSSDTGGGVCCDLRYVFNMEKNFVFPEIKGHSKQKRCIQH